MKPMAVILFVAKLVLSVLVGRGLFALWMLYPGNMPDIVEHTLRGLLHLFSQDKLANPDDMEVLAGLLYMAVTIFLGVILVFGGSALVKMYRNDRRSIG